MFDKMRKGAFLLTLAGLAAANLTGSPARAESSNPAVSAPIRDRAATPAFTWEDWDAPQISILYNQMDNPGPSGIGSQNFEAVYDAYDDFGADDFVIPANTSWKIVGVGVDGIYFNCLPDCTADSFNVMFHLDNGGLPNDPPVLTRSNLAYTVDPPGCGITSPCTFRIPVVPAVTAPASPTPRHAWVSVQANMAFGTDGQWGWTDRTVQSNSAAAWKNPGGGFLVCPTWSPMAGCIGVPEPDFMFAIAGTHTP